MARTYVTFGQVHIHSINGKTFDKDCVAVIECLDANHGRELAFEIFKSKFSFEYSEDQWECIADMRLYPRGYITVNDED